jgi:hypothetical protein
MTNPDTAPLGEVETFLFAAVGRCGSLVQEAIAHFYPTCIYVRSLGPDIRERAARRVFTPPGVHASAICPHCAAPNAVPEMEGLLAFVCRRCGNPVKAKRPRSGKVLKG